MMRSVLKERSINNVTETKKEGRGSLEPILRRKERSKKRKDEFKKKKGTSSGIRGDSN